NVFYIIKSLDDGAVGAGTFYVLILNKLQEMVESTSHIAKSSYKHVRNNHKKLKFNQIRDLKAIDSDLELLFKETKVVFDEQSFVDIDNIFFNLSLLLVKISIFIE